MSERDVRALVAAERRLDPEAAKFLVGETLAEVEASAEVLVKLLAREPDMDEPTDEQEPDRGARDLFSGAARAKAERQRSFLDALAGRGPQPRDATGRFAPSGFDGGARGSVPARPPETHDQTLTRLLRTGEANAGRRL